MGLFRCIDCKKKISDKALSCPYCGRTNDIKSEEKVIKRKMKNSKVDQKKYIILGGILLILFIIFGIAFFQMISEEYFNTEDDTSDDIDYMSEYDIIEDSIDNQMLFVRGNGDLSYSSYSITSYGMKSDTEYEPSGYVYFSREYSDRKWRADLSCTCNVYVEEQRGGCSCNVSRTATIVW